MGRNPILLSFASTKAMRTPLRLSALSVADALVRPPPPPDGRCYPLHRRQGLWHTSGQLTCVRTCAAGGLFKKGGGVGFGSWSQDGEGRKRRRIDGICRTVAFVCFAAVAPRNLDGPAESRPKSAPASAAARVPPLSLPACLPASACLPVPACLSVCLCAFAVCRHRSAYVRINMLPASVCCVRV